MSTWNYRVIRTTTHTNVGDLIAYDVREVYYDETGKITAVSAAPSPVCSDLEPSELADGKTEEDAIEALRVELHRFRQATEKPIVDLDALGFED